MFPTICLSTGKALKLLARLYDKTKCGLLNDHHPDYSARIATNPHQGTVYYFESDDTTNLP